VLDNYNLKKKGSDPAMPCLEAKEPVLGCACWNTLTASQVGEGMYPSSCTLDPSSEDVLFYEKVSEGAETLTEMFSVSAGACLHYNSVTLDAKSVTLDPDKEKVCRREIFAIAETDFRGSEFDCLPPPPPPAP
jgi:hypothetical protein